MEWYKGQWKWIHLSNVSYIHEQVESVSLLCYYFTVMLRLWKCKWLLMRLQSLNRVLRPRVSVPIVSKGVDSVRYSDDGDRCCQMCAFYWNNSVFTNSLASRSQVTNLRNFNSAINYDGVCSALASAFLRGNTDYIEHVRTLNNNQYPGIEGILAEFEVWMREANDVRLLNYFMMDVDLRPT